jgi:pimeloyl-ACP methyl ester carboxylesterase
MFETVGRLSRESCRDFKYAQVQVRDGTSLGLYESGPDNAPAVVLVNPIGAPILLASRLMGSLADRYRVICWEQRGTSSDLETFTRKPHDFAAFVNDLVDVVEHIGGGRCGLIGICSGASVAIRAVAQGWVHAAPLILVSPLVRFARGYVPSLFDRAVVPYMQMIGSGNRALAKDLMDLDAAKPAERNGGTEDEILMEAAGRWSMRSLESLLVYARAVQAFSAPRLETEFSRIAQRACVFAAADDTMVTIQSVRSLVQQLPQADLTEYPQGGHLLVGTSKQLHAAIRGCLDAAH